MQTLRSKKGKGLAHGHMLSHWQSQEWESEWLLLSSPHAASLETGGKEGRGEAGIGGGEARTGQPCLLRPALPQLPAAHECGKTCQTSPRARPEWQSLEPQGHG